MISDPISFKAIIIALKATLIFQAALIFYFFGKDEKIPYSARGIFFILASGGCLFLASGLIFENSFLIKGGIFILIVKALIDAHFIVSKYQRNKSFEKKEGESDAKK